MLLAVTQLSEWFAVGTSVGYICIGGVKDRHLIFRSHGFVINTIKRHPNHMA